MGFNENRFISPLFKLFGKRLAKVPPTPANLDIIQFNSTSNEWELISGIIGNAVQSSSNVGTGDGLALPRVLDDLPFKTLVDGVEIVITVSAQELTFSIGAIAISKITGLQVILDSKIETLTNVGTGAGIAKPKVAQNVDLKSILAGAGITINSLTNEIEIIATGTGGAFDILADNTLGADSDTFDSTVFSAREFLLVLIHLESVGGSLDSHMRFNNDAGIKYAYQRETNFSSNSTFVNQDHYEFDIGTPLNDFAIIWIDNPDGKNKLIRQMQQGDPSVSVGTAPQVGSIGGKFVESSQVTQINLLNIGVGDYLGGACRIIVMGSKT